MTQPVTQPTTQPMTRPMSNRNADAPVLSVPSRSGAAPTASPTAGMLNVTQHWFDHDMDQWGKTRGQDVHESGNRLSSVLGPDGAPLVYAKPRLGFDLTPRRR